MKTRILHTKFWQDSWVASLSIKSKLLFLYLVTNDRVSLTGAYEVPISYIAVESGLTSAEVVSGMKDLKTKIEYVDGHVVIINHKKYQDYSQGNKNQRSAYLKEFDSLPEIAKGLLNGDISTSYPTSPSSSSQLDIIHNTKNKTHKSKTKNQNTEIIKGGKEKTEEPEIINKQQGELLGIVQFYNQIFGKNISSTRGFEKNFEFWIKIHSVEKMKDAIIKAFADKFWKDKMTLQILFRKKNTQGEDVDYIEDLNNRDTNAMGDFLTII